MKGAEQNPWKSKEKIADDLGINRNSAYKMFKDMGIRKRKLITRQLLTQAHTTRRIEACKRFLIKMKLDPNWLDKVNI